MSYFDIKDYLSFGFLMSFRLLVSIFMSELTNFCLTLFRNFREFCVVSANLTLCSLNLTTLVSNHQLALFLGNAFG